MGQQFLLSTRYTTFEMFPRKCYMLSWCHFLSELPILPQAVLFLTTRVGEEGIRERGDDWVKSVLVKGKFTWEGLSKYYGRISGYVPCWQEWSWSNFSIKLIFNRWDTSWLIAQNCIKLSYESSLSINNQRHARMSYGSLLATWLNLTWGWDLGAGLNDNDWISQGEEYYPRKSGSVFPTVGPWWLSKFND